jgi:hypothetical protein
MSEGTELNLVLRNKNREILSTMEMKGMEIMENNPFFNDLAEIMTDEKVKEFFDKYFKNMDEIKTTVLYMKWFRLFQQRYADYSEEELSKYVNIYLLQQAMANKDIRSTLIQATMEHLKDNKLPILDLTPEVLKKHKKKLKLKKKIDKYIKKMRKKKANKYIKNLSKDSPKETTTFDAPTGIGEAESNVN